MKACLPYLLIILSAASCRKNEDAIPQDLDCINVRSFGRNVTLLGKWTLVATRTNPNVMFGGKGGDFDPQCGLELQISASQMNVTDRINAKDYSSPVRIQEAVIDVIDSEHFYPDFRGFTGNLRYEIVGETDLLITISQGYEGEGKTYKFKALN